MDRNFISKQLRLFSENLPHPYAIPGDTVGGGVVGALVVTPELTET